jgi:glycosyltransferase involved in cell wall biosynthesis
MSTTPRVSVIIPAFNAARYIARTLDSLLAQTYPDIEIIVIDDGSTDDTAACVAEYGPRVRYAWQPNSGGCSKPRNHGIALATGELLVFIDSDDLMAPHRIASEVEALMQHPEANLVFSNYRDFEDSRIEAISHFDTCARLSRLLKSQRHANDIVVLTPGVSAELLLTENFGHSSPMIRRPVLEAVGLYDEILRASEDFDFQYRVAEAGPIAVIPQVGWYKRQHQSSMSSNHENILTHKILTRLRLLAREADARRRRQISNTLGRFYWAFAYHETGRNNLRALWLGLISFRYQPFGNPKLFARIVADMLGRDTHGAVR